MLTRCKICGSNQLNVTYAVLSNADGPLLDKHSLLVCRECGAGHTQPEPEPADISSYYEQGIYEQSGGRAGKLIDAILSLLADWRIREIDHIWGKNSCHLLDVGCGKGRFLARAVKKNWQVQGTDVVLGQVLAVSSRYGLSAFHGEVWEAGFAPNSFDIVTSWHVLEHLYEPHKVVAEVKRILRPGGMFVFEVPNLSSWQAQIGKGNWFQLDVPRHLLHYTPSSVTHLLLQHGFQVVKIRTFAFELGIFGMLQSVINRTGLPPNVLFRWLKRSEQISAFFALVNILLAATLFIPSVILEIFASSVQAGGVIRITAVKT